MTEATVGFLYKLATSIPHLENRDPLTLLRSHYLMRCKDITRGYGLPDKQFSTQARCPHCCLEWTQNTKIKLKPIKLTSRQKKRIKMKKVNNFNRFRVDKKKKWLHSNEMEQICSFCTCSTVTKVIKPTKIKENNSMLNNQTQSNKEDKGAVKIENTKQTNKKSKVENQQVINVYSNAFDVFSMKNEKNTLKTTVKETPKIIKNSKKKKDKFAGLCMKAVLASAKMKEDKKKSNKLNLFLKPSS